ncbi:MAG: thioredoxin family protein [Eubacteriales bacterium]|nr:thioredoxin family protein [Eubacteriales bacterium]
MTAKNIDKEQFQELLKDSKPLLIDFWAPWCSYCRRISPAYDKIAEQYADLLTVAKINIDEEAHLAETERIEVIPVLVLYKDGKAIGSITAPESKAAIDLFIQKSVEKSGGFDE